MEPFLPTKDVLYRIQNVEFGTFLELRDQRDKLVMRPLKDSRWQQWHFKRDGTNTYQIVNAAAKAPDTPYILSTSNSSVVEFVDQPDFNAAQQELWKVYSKDNDFYIVNFIRPNSLILRVEENGTLALKPQRGFSADSLLSEDHRWKILEVFPSLKDGEYRVRTLNGLGLHTRSNSKDVFISHQDDEDHRLWTFKSLGNGKCTIKNVALQKFLKLRDVNGEGVVSLSDSDTLAEWNIKANSEFTYMIYAEHKESRPRQDLALSLKDGKAVLRQMKIAHNRIWLVEPDEDVNGSSNTDPLDGIALRSGNKYKLQCADGSYLAVKMPPSGKFYCDEDSSLAEKFKLLESGNNRYYTLRFEEEDDWKPYLGVGSGNVLEPQTANATNWFLERAEPSSSYYYICQTGDNQRVLSRGKKLDDKPYITQKDTTSKLQKWSFVPE